MTKKQKMPKIPYSFKNEVQNGQYVLTLSGVIRKKLYEDDEAIDAKSIREMLDDVTNDVLIRLNSGGGDVFEGIEIYNYLKKHTSHITVEVTGYAASAATFILSGADKVIMNTGTSVMIHEASTYAWGNKQEIQKTLNALETIDGSIISIYSERTNQSKEQLETWMKEETWFTAEEAVQYGFADEIADEEEELEPENDDIAAIVQRAVAVALAEHQPAQPKAEEPQEPKQQQKKSLLGKLIKGDV